MPVRRRRPDRPAVLALLLAAAAGDAASQVQWPVSFDAGGVPLSSAERAAIESHVAAAGAAWSARLEIVGPRSIEVEVRVNDSLQRANGASVTSAFVERIGQRDTFEQGAARELKTGVDPNALEPDIRITINPDYLRNELWFDPDPFARTAPVPTDRTDAMTIILHELGHALAYNGFANPTTGVPPDTFWSTFDRWMLPGAPTLFDGPRAVVAFGRRPDLTTGNNKHWGNPAVPAAKAGPRPTPPIRFNAGVPIPLPACEGLESIDPPLGPDGRPALPKDASLLDELMNGVVVIRGLRYGISDLDAATLLDVGLPARTERVFGSGFED